MLVFKGQAIDFDASQITQLHKLIAERVAKMQAILGSIAHAIEAGQITSIEEIDSPEKIEGLKLDSWNA
jgi:hypothetical protein